MKTGILIFLLTLVCLLELHTNDSKPMDTLRICEITEPKLYDILDSLIEFEKQCDYYNENLDFYIWISTYCKNIIMLQIGSDSIFHITPTPICISGFYINNHLFICRDTVDNPLIKRTNKWQLINIPRDLPYHIDTKQDVNHDNIKIYNSEIPDIDEINVAVVEENKYTKWYYGYYNKQFISLRKIVYCK